MPIEKWVKRVIGIGCVGVLLSGCIGPSIPRVPTTDFEKDRTFLASSLTSPPEEGSIWSRGGFASLFADVKARQIGDVVTISVVESATASKNATTKTTRDSGLQADWSGLFDALAGRVKLGGQKIGTSHKIDLANNFDGEGATTRSSSMTAYITARVIRVLPNGTMVVRGTRQVQVNSETQYIFIQGVIRPEDISPLNVILSTYVAEAIIELNGRGPISDKQNPGWLMRIVDWVWPF